MSNLKKNTKIVFVVFCGLFVSLIVYLTYFIVYERDQLIQSSYNRRLWEQERKVIRGTIYDAMGKPLADTVTEKDTKKRIYPAGKVVGPLIGYSDEQLGRAGLENVLNGELLGITEKDPMVILRQKILGTSNKGNDVYLTLDYDLQAKAYELFSNRRGALVAMDPKTGAILALVSSPGYDPTNLKDKWEGLLQDSEKPLINRATQGLYPPGSIFKIVTLAAALKNKPDIKTRTFYTPGYAKVNGSIIRDYEGFSPGNYDLTGAFRYSSNSIFVQISKEVGKDNMLSMAEDFGFNTKLRADIPVAISKFPKPPIVGGNVELAEDSIGQGKVLVTPLQMAKITAIVANGGKDITCHILDKSVSPLGITKTLRPKLSEKDRILSEDVARTIRDLMVDVVENGTGRAAAIRGIGVGGKTGSAENPHGKTHAWFTGFAPADNPKIAVAVIVENAGSGGRNAGPIARDIMLEYLNKINNRSDVN